MIVLDTPTFTSFQNLCSFLVMKMRTMTTKKIMMTVLRTE